MGLAGKSWSISTRDRLERALQKNRHIRRQYNLLKTFSNWWLYYADKLGFLSDDELIFNTRGDITIRVPKRLYPEFKSIFLRQHYLEGLFLPLPERPTILDIGANIGFFSLFASTLWNGEVFAYEPVPANYVELTRNIAANPHVTVTCRQLAVSGASGTVDLFFDHAASHTTTATAYPSVHTPGKRKAVKAVTLEDIFESEGLMKVDLLKMDCEGSEFATLFQTSPEILGGIDQMAIEVHNNRDIEHHNAQNLGTYLAERGFAVTTNDMGTYLWARQIKGV